MLFLCSATNDAEMSDTYELYYLLQGEDDVFPVEISSASSIAVLKKAIYDAVSSRGFAKRGWDSQHLMLTKVCYIMISM